MDCSIPDPVCCSTTANVRWLPKTLSESSESTMPAKRRGVHCATTVILLVASVSCGGGTTRAQSTIGGKSVQGTAPKLFSFGVEGVAGPYHVVVRADGTVVATGFGRVVAAGRRVPRETLVHLTRVARRIHFGRLPPVIGTETVHNGKRRNVANLVIQFAGKTVTAEAVSTPKTAGFDRLFWNLRRASGLQFCGEVAILASPCLLSRNRL